jgi:hypothetical protein
MAPHWRLGGSASIDVSVLFTGIGWTPEGAKNMRWHDHLYPVAIEQVLDVASLARLSDAAADEADESGDLAGNRMYQDLRGYGWPDVARALVVEHRMIARLQEAEDLEAEAMRIDDERLDCFEPSDGLWGLDVGVASVTIALSAFGAIPVASCNAAGFGGTHQGAYPYVAFFIGGADPNAIISTARAAGVGVRNDTDGVAQIFGASDLSLLRFAETALKSDDRDAQSSFSRHD